VHGRYTPLQRPATLEPQSLYRLSLVSPTVEHASGLRFGIAVAGMQILGEQVSPWATSAPALNHLPLPDHGHYTF
jgi:hypothetical protein